jgi:hypothetical protein
MSTKIDPFYRFIIPQQWLDHSTRKMRRNLLKFIQIHYSATVARSPNKEDAQKPVEIQAAKGIKGLMTVIDRHPEF